MGGTLGSLTCTGNYPGEPGLGTINFGNGGATVTTGSLTMLGIQMSGSATINTRGLIAETNFVFDSTASLKQTLRPAGRCGR